MSHPDQPLADHAEADETEPDAALTTRRWMQKRRWQGALLVLAVILAGSLYAWFSRERIAGNLIAEQLDAYGIEATYDIESIGPQQQIISNVAVGESARPDLLVDQVIVSLRYRFGTPTIGRVKLINPRLYGTYQNDKLSFGALDPIVFAESDDPASLPDIDLVLRDGRARIDTDYGPLGIKADGAGQLSDSFNGVMAAVMPQFEGEGCTSGQVSAYGSVTTDGGEPVFSGPLRLRNLACADSRLSLAQVDADAKIGLGPDLQGVDAEIEFASRRLAVAANDVEELDGDVRFQWRDGQFNGRYDLSASALVSPQIVMSSLSAEGDLRGRDGFGRLEVQVNLAGSDLVLGRSMDEALTGQQEAVSETLLEPILAKIRTNLKTQQQGSTFAADLTVRKTGEIVSATIPSAIIQGRSGDALLSLSRIQFSNAGSGTPRFTGNIRSGGAGLPQIRGRMEQTASGNLALRLAMAEYSAPGSSLAIPELAISQANSGAIGFAGEVRASGPLAGGSVSRLRLPVSGNWTQRSGLSVWQSCTRAQFDRLVLANLTLEQNGLTLCPQSGGAIVAVGNAGLQISAGTPGLDLTGSLGETPIALSTGAVGFAYPGVMVAREIDVKLGPAGTTSRFTLSELDATFGNIIGGRFDDADVQLEQVPLDIMDAQGNWTLTDGVLSLSDGAFRLIDRQTEARFEPLIARDATLSLADSQITALATLRNPESDRVVTRVTVAHNLETSAGRADINVDGLRFDDQLQPEQLTNNAKGVIALVEGEVSGAGEITWAGDTITSSGAFSSDGLDFAAAFGPVRGASGTVEFTDLLALTTAPDQTISIASVNPGIEVLDGEVQFALTGGEFLAVNGGSWPFMGGQLVMQPVDMQIGAEEERRYIFEMIGLDAAVFVSEFDLANISATGLFDGAIPIVFDAAGNGRIENGLLVSRAPGGNVSYVGELTYEDLSAMANFAFESLRSLNYSQMSIGMEGSLTGEIVTKVRFDGVQQGEGASSNIITRRIARLPIRFNVNIRSQFYQLITQMKSLYDPAYIKDPRDVGLVGADGQGTAAPTVPQAPAVRPEDFIPDEPPIQTQESENMP